MSAPLIQLRSNLSVPRDALAVACQHPTFHALHTNGSNDG